MQIGVPKEIQNAETRVGLTPAGVAALSGAGHQIVVEAGAGGACGYDDAEYERNGAVLGSAAAAWAAELVVKVKEPQPSEYQYLRDNALFTYLHLAANQPLASELMRAGTFSLSYDTVQEDTGKLPLLAPMSALAGRMAIVVGGYYLLSATGGRGVVLSPVAGVSGGDVVVIGAGVAGSNAALCAAGMGANVTILDLSPTRITEVVSASGDKITGKISTPETVREAVLAADLVVGAVLVPGQRAPKVVDHSTVLGMRSGSILVDIAIDQGGCFADSRITSHVDPIYRVGPTRFYCVPNMPGAAGVTATKALTEATLPYVLELANRGIAAAVAANPALAAGVNVRAGEVVHPGVRAGLGLA